MKTEHHFPCAATVFFALTVAVAFCSWIGSVYGLGGVQSLLSAEGIRWELRHTLSSYVEAPALGIVLMLLFGLGVVAQSGMCGVMARALQPKQRISRKERRALVLAGITLFIYILSLLAAAFMPGTLLRSVVGTLANSPLLDGIPFIASLGVGLTGLVFGYAADRFRTDRDVVRAMSCLISRHATYFIELFFIVQFFTSLEYTHLAEWAGADAEWVRIVFHLCCFLPIVWRLCRKKPSQG